MKVIVVLIVVLAEVFGADNRVGNVAEFGMNSRIFRGVVANLGTFPFAVPLFVSKPNGDSFCGASLISDQYVLTAAHCLAGATRVKVYLGARDISIDSDPNRVEFEVGTENMIVHEKYDGPAYIHDIALLRLPKKITFSDEVQAIRLAGPNDINLDQSRVVVTGWGKTGNRADRSNVLRYASRKIVPNGVCETVYRHFFHPSNICVDASDQSPCPGDSGGPAVIIDKTDRAFTQVGVASYVHSTGCESGHPVSYTRVTSYLDWIHAHTGVPIRK